MDDLKPPEPIAGLLDVLTAAPTPLAAVVQRLAGEATGPPTDDEVLRELQARGDVLETPTEGVNLLAPADRAVLTHVRTERRLGEALLEYERLWLDTDTPALGGLTPRAAVAAGGGARRELAALLDDLAWVRRYNPGGMNPGRVRVELGLADG